MLLDNPFHVLGLPADCTAKELTQRESRIRAYLEVGKPLAFDEDLLFPKCKRNSGTVKVASTALQDAGQRIKSGLFWLTRSGLLDDAGFDVLNKEGPLAALLHWHKVADRSPITEKYISSVSNYASICILIPLMLSWDEMKETVVPMGFKTRQQLVYKGLELKSILIGSTGDEVLKGFLVSVSDEMTGSDIQRAVDQFGVAVKELVDECRKYGVTLAMSQVAKSLGKGGARCSDLMQPFLTEHRRDLERALVECEKARDSRPQDAVKSGKRLLAQAKSSLQELKRIAGTDDLLYQSLVDQVAEEMLQCGIDNFNHADNRDEETSELAEQVEELVERALSLEPGPRLAIRIKENLEIIRSRKEGLRRNELIPDDISKWLADAVQMMDSSTRGRSIVTFVRNSIGSGQGSILRQLDLYRSRASEARVGGFERSMEFRATCTLVCQTCVGLLVRAAEDDIGKLAIMQDSLPLLTRMKGVFIKSGASIPVGKYPVDAEAYDHLLRNWEILKKILPPPRPPRPPRPPKPPTPEPTSSGCMVAAAFLFAVFGLTLIALT